jgi:hypothetical protein
VEEDVWEEEVMVDVGVCYRKCFLCYVVTWLWLHFGIGWMGGWESWCDLCYL